MWAVFLAAVIGVLIGVKLETWIEDNFKEKE